MKPVKVKALMSEEPQCPQCGTPLPGGALGGLCPACLLRQGVAADSGLDDKPNKAGFTPPSVAELARLFPQLEIIQLIGRGGMGAVYQARQPKLDRLVALKILPPGIGADSAFAERFAREAKALAKLNHPGIVTLYEFGQVSVPTADGGGPVAPPLYFFLMEFVDGVNLRQLLGKARVSPREALAIVPQICDALQFAHDQGIVHRDIKPENILLDRRGRVKVADFGLAKIVAAQGESELAAGQSNVHTQLDSPGELTEAGKVMGTPDYMSPEQVQAPGGVDHRSDIYALGVVFYEMLTGELPGKRMEPPSRRVRIDVRLDEVVLRALEEAPERRYQHASELKTGVETIATALGSIGVAGPAAVPPWMKGVDYRSKTMLFGWPLVHVASGVDPQTGRARVARGIIAIGDRAQGVIAMGGMATGVIAIGGLAVGVLAIGGGAIGLVALGGLAIAMLLAIGGGAVAPIALGGGALGFYAFGGKGIGVHVYDALGQDAAARAFFTPWARQLMNVIPTANVVFLSIFLPIMIGLPRWLQRRGREGGGAGTAEGKGRRTFQGVVLWTARVLGTVLVFLFGVIAIGEGLPPIWSQPDGVRVELVALVLIIAGLLAGWKWDGWAALCLLAGSALFHVVEWRWVLRGALEVPTWVGGLYLLSWLLERGTGRSGLSEPRQQHRLRPWVAAVAVISLLGIFVVLPLIMITEAIRRPAMRRATQEAIKAEVTPLEQLSAAAQAQAISIFNDIEDFGHEFDAAFTARNIVAAQTGTRRLLNLLSNFNSVVKGTDCEFPPELIVAVGKVKAELDAGDLEAARHASQHSPAFAAEFKRIGQRVEGLAKAQVGQGAPRQLLLEMRRVLDAAETNTAADTLPSPHGGEPMRVGKTVLLGDDALEKSRLSWSEHNKTWEIEILFTPSGTRRFADVTRTNLGRQLAMVYNGRVLSAPVIRSEIAGGKGMISGNFKFAEAAEMVWRLNGGSAPSGPASDGPAVSEILLKYNPDGVLPEQNLLLDLDTGKAVALPPEFADWNEGRIERWIAETGVDVGLNSRHGRSLESLAPAMVAFSPDLWPRVPSRAELLQQLEPHATLSDRTPVGLDGMPSPAVFAFCTAEGAVGLLHVRKEGTNSVLVNIKLSDK
jgi:hypothetical protein